jgi:hypothetical protein
MFQSMSGLVIHLVNWSRNLSLFLKSGVPFLRSSIRCGIISYLGSSQNLSTLSKILVSEYDSIVGLNLISSVTQLDNFSTGNKNRPTQVLRANLQIGKFYAKSSSNFCSRVLISLLNLTPLTNKHRLA